MSSKGGWFITGAGRGMGVNFAKAALAAGNAVVATVVIVLDAVVDGYTRMCAALLLSLGSLPVRIGARRVFGVGLARHGGHSRAGGIAKDITFVEEADPRINDQIDATYRARYRRSASYVAPSNP